MALLGIMAIIAVVGCDPAAGQEEQKTPRVDVTQSAGPAGGKVSVPIRLTGVEDARVSAVTLTLRFVADKLTFGTVEIGGLGESAGVTATAKAERRAGDTLLVITLATAEKDGARAPMPDGPIAQVVFTVAKNLKPETVIPLKVQAAGADAAVTLATRDAEVIVSNPPAISCFFYMH